MHVYIWQQKPDVLLTVPDLLTLKRVIKQMKEDNVLDQYTFYTMLELDPESF